MPKKTDNPGTTMSIFLGKERPVYENLRTEVRTLWFQKYGESLNNNKLIIMALKALKDSLLSIKTYSKDHIYNEYYRIDDTKGK
jgi:hypothetical protein